MVVSASYGMTYAQFGSPVGLPPIASRITIEGNGATIARQGNAPAFGLMAVGNSGDLTLQSVTLRGGSSFGGLSNSGNASIKNSIVSGNTGSGVSNYGTLTIENTIISDNTGGGLSNGGGTLTIENSTISGNTTNFWVAVFNQDGRLTIANSTISGNRAAEGGGVSNAFGLVFGYSATLILNNSLIAGNQAGIGPEIWNNSIVNANNFNLFGTNGNAGVSGFAPGPTDIVPGVPLAKILGPLQNNGGPTQTHALVDGSPALDAGDPGGCRDSQGSLLSTDQRGFARHIDNNNDGAARCDIGAFEAKELFVVAAVLPSSRSVQINSPATAFANIINAGQKLATGCTISPITGMPATLTFQTTDPATNQVTNSPNTSVDIPAGAAQSFIFALTPNALIAPTDVQLSFECANANPAPIHSGVNTLLFSASTTSVPDIVALAATLNNDGIVNIPGTNGTGVFAVATVNVGAGDTLTPYQRTREARSCRSMFSFVRPIRRPALASHHPRVACLRRSFLNETPTFGVFVAAAEDISFIPETNRIFVRFKDSNNVTRGLTSVAVRTQ